MADKPEDLTRKAASLAAALKIPSLPDEKRQGYRRALFELRDQAVAAVEDAIAHGHEQVKAAGDVLDAITAMLPTDKPHSIVTAHGRGGVTLEEAKRATVIKNGIKRLATAATVDPELLAEFMRRVVARSVVHPLYLRASTPADVSLAARLLCGTAPARFSSSIGYRDHAGTPAPGILYPVNVGTFPASEWPTATPAEGAIILYVSHAQKAAHKPPCFREVVIGQPKEPERARELTTAAWAEALTLTAKR